MLHRPKKRTKKELSAYLAYLKALQTRLMELITFVFDEEYHPSILKKMSANQRYALYCRANHCTARYEYQYIFDYPELESFSFDDDHDIETGTS